MTTDRYTSPKHSKLAQQKNHCRHNLTQQRRLLTAAQRQLYSQQIRDQLLTLPAIDEAQVLFSYLSLPSEVDTHILIQQLLTTSKTIVIPQIDTSTSMLSVPLVAWENLLPGAMGILSLPTTTAPYTGSVDIAIIPGLGFTHTGGRIGFGRGYYDRWLAQHPTTYKIALAFEIQLLETLPLNATDVMMDLIITEKRIIHTRAQSL